MRLLASSIPASTCTTHSTCSFPPPCLARPPLPSALAAVLRRHRGHSHRLAPPSCREAPPGSTPSSGAPRWSWEAPLTSHELVPFRPCRRRDPSNSGFPCAPKLPRAIGVPLGELSYLLPLLAYLARPLAASPRAPERSAAELVAGETPVTFWSRAQARWTRRTTGILPSPSFRSVARCFAFAITRPKVVAAFSVAGDAPVVPDASHRHHRVRGAGPRP